MSTIPPLRFRKAFRANLRFSLPPEKDETESQTRFLRPVVDGKPGPPKLELAESLSDEETEKGIFHVMEFHTGKTATKSRVFLTFNCRDHRLEVHGVRLTLVPCPEPSGPKCRGETPCKAMFERRKDGEVYQLHCHSTTEVALRLAVGLQKKGLLKKAWKPSLVPSDRAVAARHVIDLRMEVPRAKDEPKSMALLTVPM